MNQIYDPSTTCCFTGHRYISAQKQKDVKIALQKAVAEHISAGVFTFISGGAVGFDTLAARCVLKAKETNPNVALVMILPCRDQSARWSIADRQAYDSLLMAADDIYILNERYVTGCMHQRNRAMVRQSGYCIAYYDGKPSGTGYTVGIAKENGLKLTNLYR